VRECILLPSHKLYCWLNEGKYFHGAGPVQFLVDLLEQAMWYEVVWPLLRSNLRQGSDNCTNQQVPSHKLETRMV
jgi:hypothetical protein